MSEFLPQRLETEEERSEAYKQLRKCVKRKWFQALTAEQVSETHTSVFFDSPSGEIVSIFGGHDNGETRFQVVLHKSAEVFGPKVKYRFAEDEDVTREDYDPSGSGAPTTDAFFKLPPQVAAEQLLKTVEKSVRQLSEERNVGINGSPITAAEANWLKNLLLSSS